MNTTDEPRYTILVTDIFDTDSHEPVPEGTLTAENVFAMIQRASGPNIENISYGDEIPGDHYVAHDLGYDIYFTICKA